MLFLLILCKDIDKSWLILYMIRVVLIIIIVIVESIIFKRDVSLNVFYGYLDRKFKI